MNKKSRSEQKEPPPNAPDAKGSPAAQLPTFPAMTSSEYRRLCEGISERKLVTDYINRANLITQEQILEQQMRTLGKDGAKDYRQALTRSQEIHQETLWEARRELVAIMNRATLESLAEHFGILTASEFVRDHPDANDLDKGLLLTRMRQFLVWDGEYQGTAPEMRGIDVEAAKKAAETRAKKPLPPDNAPFESVLRYASACKKASDDALLRALKDCIAVACICPAIERSLVLRIEDIREPADNLKERVRDLDEYVNRPKERVIDADEQYGSIEQLITYLGQALKKIADRRVDDGYVKETLADLMSDTQKLQSRHEAVARPLDEVRACREQFASGKGMPPIVENATEKWMTSQFTAGAPVGSIVRMAWLLDVFHPFWKKHQSAYLALDPTQNEMQKKAVAHGKLGAAKKVDEKWRKFTSLFAQYASSTVRPGGKISPEELQALVDGFGQHLMDQRTKGATDKRSVANIKDFISTLLTLMNRNVGEDLIQSTWQLLRTGREDQRKESSSGDFFYDAGETKLKRADRKGAQKPAPFAEDLTAHSGGKLRGKAGQFRRNTFSSLPLETFKACLEILRDDSHQKNARSGRGGTRRGGAKKNTRA